MASASAIPVVDLREPEETATAKLREACATSGFFYLVGHGVAPEVMAQAMQASAEFFALGTAAKAAAHGPDGVPLPTPPEFRGYRGLGQVALDPNNQKGRGDTKEQWSMGRECGPETAETREWPDLHGVNAWPSPTDCPAFRERMQTYFQAVWGLADRLLELVAMSLDNPRDCFHDIFCSPTLTLALNHYSTETSRPEDGILGCGAHTDYGMLTLLLMDSVPALQIAKHKGATDDMAFPVEGAESTIDRGWTNIPPLEGAFVINCGDMMQRFTNDKYLSNMHRVVNLTGRERYSIAFFYEPNADGVVECLPSCCGEGQPAKYGPITYGPYLRKKYQATGEEIS